MASERNDESIDEFEKDKLIQAIKNRLRDTHTCQEVTEAYEQLTTATCNTISRYIGPKGTESVIHYSLRKARAKAPLLDKVAAKPAGIDLTELHLYAKDPSCDQQEVMFSVIQLAEELFLTLRQLTGPTLAEILLRDFTEQ